MSAAKPARSAITGAVGNAPDWPEPAAGLQPRRGRCGTRSDDARLYACRDGFSTASVALVHGMSRPIGAFFHVPHGLSNAMLLPAVTAFSLAAAPERYADCARAIGVADAADDDAGANDKLLTALQTFNRALKVLTSPNLAWRSRTLMRSLPSWPSRRWRQDRRATTLASRIAARSSHSISSSGPDSGPPSL